MDTGRCHHGLDCHNVHIRSLQSVVDIRYGTFGRKFLESIQGMGPERLGDLTGFITPCGTAYEWEYPYYAITDNRPFYQMRGCYFQEDWPMPACPFPARSEVPYWRNPDFESQGGSFAAEDRERQLVEEQGSKFRERQLHLDPRRVGNRTAPTPASGASEQATTPDTSGGPRNRRWGDSDTKEEADLQMAIDLSNADQLDPPLAGPYDQYCYRYQVAPPAAAPKRSIK